MAHSDSKPGEIPEIHDEAVDTPLWFPAVGLALLLALAMVAFWPRADEVAAGAEGDAEVEVVGEEAPAEPAAPTPPAPAPAAEAAGGETDDFGRSPGHEHYGHGHE